MTVPEQVERPSHAKVVRKVVAHSGPQIVHVAIAIGAALEAHAEIPPE